MNRYEKWAGMSGQEKRAAMSLSELREEIMFLKETIAQCDQNFKDGVPGMHMWGKWLTGTHLVATREEFKKRVMQS